MIIKEADKAQHYRVKAEEIALCHVGDPIYSAHAWAPDPIGFISAIYEEAMEIDICLFEPLPIPDTCVQVYAEKLTHEEVDYLLLNSR